MAFGIDDFSFNTGGYDPTKSSLYTAPKNGGTQSLGGSGYEAYLKPMSYGGIGKGADFEFGKGEASYNPMNYKPTQSDTLGGKGSGTTSSIENGGQQSLGQAWSNMTDKDKSNAIMGGIDLLATAFGGKNQEQAPTVSAPSGGFRPHASQLDMSQFNSRLQMPQQKQKQPALINVI